MKNYIITLACTFILLIGFSDKTYSSIMLDCEDLYDTCIENNHYDKEDNFYLYYGYITGCASSRDICIEME